MLEITEADFNKFRARHGDDKEEEEDVTMVVGVDRQWYRIRLSTSLYLNAGGTFNQKLDKEKLRWVKDQLSTILSVHNFSRTSHAQQWSFDNDYLISRSGKDAWCWKQGWYYNGETGKLPNNDSREPKLKMVGRQFRSDQDYMHIVLSYAFNVRIQALVCGNGWKTACAFEKLVSFVHGFSVFSHSLFVSFVWHSRNHCLCSERQ